MGKPNQARNIGFYCRSSFMSNDTVHFYKRILSLVVLVMKHLSLLVLHNKFFLFKNFILAPH